jgi:hypothetical protein
VKLLTQKLGAITKTCTARCYDAVPGSNCACICGGRNHGKGLDKALENVATVFAPLVRGALGEIEVTRHAYRVLRRAREATA